MFVPACNRPVIRSSSLTGAKGFPPSLPFLHAGFFKKARAFTELLVTYPLRKTSNDPIFNRYCFAY